jgi:hypothetical protein
MQSSSVYVGSAELKNGLLIARYEYQAFDFLEAKSDAGDAEYECNESAKTSNADYFDIDSDNEVSIDALVMPAVTLDGKTIVLSGEGCVDRIDVTK